MVAAPAFSASNEFSADLDDLLFQICEELQITSARYDLAVARYGTLNTLLESSESPFRHFRPEIYPQGSMALGTTVAPIKGPHDLDFVLQLSRDYSTVDPMALIRTLYDFLRGNGIYRAMTTLKNRCVRIEYADEFYMDVLPACLNVAAGRGCIKVPDRALKGWSDSNPKGYIEEFEKKSKMIFVGRMLDKAAPVPDRQAVAEKKPLQLVVQLSKRWRDLYYANLDPKLAPISIVLTSIAAETYRGGRSVSQALTSMLGGVVDLIDLSRRRGEQHLHLYNPSNRAEDLTERWDSNPAAYDAFESGIRDFWRRWSRLMAGHANPYSELAQLFGEPVTAVLKKRAQGVQKSRGGQSLGVTGTGRIAPAAAAAVPIKRNTFYGTE
ncbi:MAG: nucleotidyltransferase [Candidatus Sulfotelmatobacter sp.]